jgi:AcrR family transcriptional regulator
MTGAAVKAESADARRGPKWQARRQAIIDTSVHLFARRGYHATGVT